MKNFVDTDKKTAQKQKLKLFRILLFNMKTKVCLKCFVNNCLWKQFFASKLPQRPSNLISFTIFVTLMSLTQFQPKIQAKKFEKGAKTRFSC